MHQNCVGNTFASLAASCWRCGPRAFSGPFGASSQPFLASGPLLGLLWALPTWLLSFFPVFFGSRGLFWAFCGLLSFFPVFFGSRGLFWPRAFSGPFVGFWASSQPFLASGPFLGLLWSLPSLTFSGSFVGFWVSSQPFLASGPFLNLLWAQPFLASGLLLGRGQKKLGPQKAQKRARGQKRLGRSPAHKRPRKGPESQKRKLRSPQKASRPEKTQKPTTNPEKAPRG